MKEKNLILIATLFLCCITAAIFSSCVKQKNCEGEYGTFIYLEEPYKLKNSKKKITALFFPARGKKSYPFEDGFITEPIREITGNVPAKFKTNDSIYVIIDLKSSLDWISVGGPLPTYSINCIEKVD